MRCSFTVARRWTTFNVVGLAGLVVQLGVLALLTRARVPVPLATALAVEAAVLHNFFCHQRWTWRDRPSVGSRATFARLARFHAVNGIVSLVGNVAITVALVRVGLHPVIANLASIIACSVVNFAAGEWLVFRSTCRRHAGDGTVSI
jgi:putative flippase GtrA